MAIGKRAWWTISAVIAVIALLIAAYLAYGKATTKAFTVYFPTTTSLYEGDPVRVLGVNVGTVSSITPREGDVKVTLDVDKDVSVPADAKAVIIAQSLVSGRFVQLTPVYDKGPQLEDGAAIPMERTAIPMEWDDVKKQLSRLTEAVGPDGPDQGTAAKAIDTFNANLQGNGEAINSSINQMSDVMGTLAAGRGDLFGTVKNLQKLTDVLAANHEQLVQFNGRIASISSVLADNTDSLNGALHELSTALVDVQGFIDTNGAAMTKSVQSLADTTTILKDKDEQLRGLLHSGPTQLANFYNIYNPLTGSLVGIFGLGMGTNLITLLCGTMAANDRPEVDETEVAQCVDTLAPVLSSITMNYPPFLTNPVNGIGATPDQLVYQNQSVKQRAQAGVVERDAESRAAIGGGLGDLLVPWGAEK